MPLFCIKLLILIYKDLRQDISRFFVANCFLLRRQIFGPKRDGNKEWKRLHNKELYSLYRSPNIFRAIKPRRLRWAGYASIMEEGMSAFKILTGTPAGKRPFGRLRRRWVDNIWMYIKEIGINTGNWVDSAQDGNYIRALLNAVLDLWVSWAMESVLYIKGGLLMQHNTPKSGTLKSCFPEVPSPALYVQVRVFVSTCTWSAVRHPQLLHHRASLSSHSFYCFLDFSLRIWKLKYIKQ